MPEQRGFTLIELLVTITVLGILLGVGVPALRDLTANNRMVALTNEIVSGLQYARSEAISRNRNVTVCPSSDGADCSGSDWSVGWIVFNDDNADGVMDGGNEVVLRANEGSSGLQAKGTADRIGFGGDGRSNVTNESIRVCDSRGKEYGRQIAIDMTGRPSVAKLSNDKECS